ncbi:FAD-dependent oxidoreductase [Kineococcus indalonis]|uniref:FAD-dependent oxidoreductase n=1 Tax=Kineococcus indalonis TaxID=2696566 RepID=UPI00196B143A|nr:NAD(P)/FAD-dependent oxidoreductase [Kineococcus indalonis]
MLVAGGGPAGLFLAALLARHGVDVVVLERRAAAPAHSRAIGLHPPALLALRALGLEAAVLAEGVRIGGGVARSRGRELGRLSFERAWPEHPFVLALPQQRTEALLEQGLSRLAPGALRRGWQVLDAREGRGEVVVDAAGPGGARALWRARVLVGADGARSAVRERAGIGAVARTYPDAYLMGDVADGTADAGTAVVHLEPGGVVESFPLPRGVRRWVVHTGRRPLAADPAVLAALVRRRTGEVLDPASSTMVSAFAPRRRMARRLVAGRRVLVGDAAHEISPIGGQGMTLGWLDARDLAPLLVRALAAGADGDLRAVEGFAGYERDRLRAARSAARRAWLNTALGRPARGAVARAREDLVRAALLPPARGALAGACSMRWAREPDPGAGAGAGTPLDTVLTASTRR